MPERYQPASVKDFCGKVPGKDSDWTPLMLRLGRLREQADDVSYWASIGNLGSVVSRLEALADTVRIARQQAQNCAKLVGWSLNLEEIPKEVVNHAD